ncbi:hypothetical protein [Ruminococcus callidus]|uniref:hypothetical protein n=1 Tax=Ruminococcus callidus TaxID=40519 RepID=UPI003520B25A
MRTAFRNVLRSAFLQLTAILSTAIRTTFLNGSLRHRSKNFYFLFYDRLPALQKMLLLALPFPQRQGFFLCSDDGSTAGTVPPSRRKSHTAVRFAM